jgi:hypothetical protein
LGTGGCAIAYTLNEATKENKLADIPKRTQILEHLNKEYLRNGLLVTFHIAGVDECDFCEATYQLLKQNPDDKDLLERMQTHHATAASLIKMDIETRKYIMALSPDSLLTHAIYISADYSTNTELPHRIETQTTLEYRSSKVSLHEQNTSIIQDGKRYNYVNFYDETQGGQAHQLIHFFFFFFLFIICYLDGRRGA